MRSCYRRNPLIFSAFFFSLAVAFSTLAVTPAGAQSGNITASYFGFQCGTGKMTNCPNATWPSSVAQPGMIRLWDSQVQWHLLNPGRGEYRWNNLDAYLDSIADHRPPVVQFLRQRPARPLHGQKALRQKSDQVLGTLERSQCSALLEWLGSTALPAHGAGGEDDPRKSPRSDRADSTCKPRRHRLDARVAEPGEQERASIGYLLVPPVPAN